MDQLRKELAELQKQQEEITKQMGESATHNNDLRENSEYIILEQKEHFVASKMRALTAEIYKLSGLTPHQARKRSKPKRVKPENIE